LGTKNLTYNIELYASILALFEGLPKSHWLTSISYFIDLFFLFSTKDFKRHHHLNSLTYYKYTLIERNSFECLFDWYLIWNCTPSSTFNRSVIRFCIFVVPLMAPSGFILYTAILYCCQQIGKQTVFFY
jgi:hypothetical protein